MFQSIHKELKGAAALGSVPDSNSSFHAVVAHKRQLFAFIVSLCRATNVHLSPALIKEVEVNAAFTQN